MERRRPRLEAGDAPTSVPIVGPIQLIDAGDRLKQRHTRVLAGEWPARAAKALVEVVDQAERLCEPAPPGLRHAARLKQFEAAGFEQASEHEARPPQRQQADGPGLAEVRSLTRCIMSSRTLAEAAPLSVGSQSADMRSCDSSASRRGTSVSA